MWNKNNNSGSIFYNKISKKDRLINNFINEFIEELYLIENDYNIGFLKFSEECLKDSDSLEEFFRKEICLDKNCEFINHVARLAANLILKLYSNRSNFITVYNNLNLELFKFIKDYNQTFLIENALYKIAYNNFFISKYKNTSTFLLDEISKENIISIYKNLSNQDNFIAAIWRMIISIEDFNRRKYNIYNMHCTIRAEITNIYRNDKEILLKLISHLEKNSPIGKLSPVSFKKISKMEYCDISVL